MKYISIFTLLLFLNIVSFSQTIVCGDFHKKYCVLEKDKKEWQYNAQSKSGLFTQGAISKMRCVIYKGMDYKISVCCETILGDKVNYKIFDSHSNELLFDNSAAENKQTFQFQSVSTRQLVIEVTVPKGATEKDKHKAIDAACVGLLIENKLSNKQGF